MNNTKIKIFSLFIFAVAMIFVPLSAMASTWTNQDFEAFNTGNLNLQGNWAVTYGSATVSTAQAHSGTKSVYSKRDSASSSANYTIGTNLFDSKDSISFSFYKSSVSGGNLQRMEFRPRNSQNYDVCMAKTYDNTVQLITADGTSTIGTFTANTWNTITINYDVANRKCRAKVNSGNYSAYFNFPTNVVSPNLNIVSLNMQNYDQTYGYYDDILFSSNNLPPFYISSPVQDEAVIDDSWITVSGVCPTNGANRIGFTNDCLGYADIQYTTACTNGTFSGQFYKSGLNDRIIARELNSVSGDCVDYDNLMDFIEVDGFQVIEGYPDDWYFNFDYYDDYDIKILSPTFDTALTLPTGSTSADFHFKFVYPIAELANMNFNIKQYNEDGTLLNGSYHNKNLANMADTSDYMVNLEASAEQSLHYVVQLTQSSEMKRQFPIGIFVSDLDFVFNPDDYDYFFPRLVEMLKEKIIFNYYFAFHDGFYNMFNTTYTDASDDALDINFKSVSGDGQYDMNVKIFSASDARVKSFAGALRPYIVAVLWLVFALYVVLRITRLFSNNE
mgnify:CR=1 FL=1